MSEPLFETLVNKFEALRFIQYQASIHPSELEKANDSVVEVIRKIQQLNMDRQTCKIGSHKFINVIFVDGNADA